VETLHTWWATELYPSKDEDNFGVVGDFEVIKAADAQATIAALTEALECALLEKPLPNGEYVHHAACNGDRRKPAGTVGISCSCRVGKATIAALQARVRTATQLIIAEIGVSGPEDLEEAVGRIVGRLQQRTAECEALKLVNDTHMKTVMKLSHVVEQRTAELEAAKADRDELQSVFDLGHTRTVEADKLWQDAHGKPEVWPDLGDLVGWLIKRHDDVQAELERVRAASNKDNKTGQMMLDDAIGERDDLRTLILALPKVEGEIRVEEGKVISVEPVRGADPPLWWRRTIATFEDGLLAKHYSKLLQHRQGMEG